MWDSRATVAIPFSPSYLWVALHTVKGKAEQTTLTTDVAVYVCVCVCVCVRARVSEWKNREREGALSTRYDPKLFS